MDALKEVNKKKSEIYNLKLYGSCLPSHSLSKPKKKKNKKNK